MSALILGVHPEPLTVRLTVGDGATLLATAQGGDGQPVDWTVAPTLMFVSNATATTDGVLGDQIHPNAAGLRRIAQGLARILTA